MSNIGIGFFQCLLGLFLAFPNRLGNILLGFWHEFSRVFSIHKKPIGFLKLIAIIPFEDMVSLAC